MSSSDLPLPPSLRKPSRKSTRSPSAPLRRASLLTPSVSAAVASTTAEHSYFTTPSTSTESPTETTTDPSLNFPASSSTAELAPQQQPEQSSMSRERSDSAASVQRKGSLLAAIGAGALRRRSGSNSSADSGNIPALASLLQTQKKDQEARKSQDSAVQREGSTESTGAPATASPDANATATATATTATPDPESEAAPKRPTPQKRFSTLTKALSFRRRGSVDDSNSANAETASRKSSVGSPKGSPIKSPPISIPPTPEPAPLKELTVPPSDGIVSLMSPVVEETPMATSPEQLPEQIPPETFTVSPQAASVDLTSTPNTPAVPQMPVVTQPTIVLDSPVDGNEERTGGLSAPLEESGVLVASPMSMAISHLSEREEAPAVAAPAQEVPATGTPLAQSKEVVAEDGSAHDSQEWEQVAASQSMLGSKPSIVDAGTIPDDASSVTPGPAVTGYSVLSSLQEKMKEPADGDDEGASMAVQAGDTDPSERVPPTSMTSAFPREVQALVSSQTDFTPPITPEAEKFPMLRRSTSSKVPTGQHPLANSSGPSDSSPRGTPSGGAFKLGGILPSRDTVEEAAHYAVQPSRSTNAPQVTPLSTIRVSVPFPSSQSRPTPYTTPAVPLNAISRPSSKRSPPFPLSPSTHDELTPFHYTYSLWDLVTLPVTAPFTLSRVMLGFSIRAFIFGVVFGVTLVRLGTRAVGSAVLGRNI